MSFADEPHAPGSIPDWTAASVGRRLARRILCHLPLAVIRLAAGPRSKTALDAAYWSGVRRAASRRQWRRLTKSSYVGVYYHRIAGELLEGQERLDLRPQTLARQMRLLRLLRFRPLTPETMMPTTAHRR